MADTEKTLREFLNKIATEQKYSNYEIIMNELFSGGANYTSKLYTAIIRERNKEDLHLFAKVAIIKEELRNDFSTNIYDNERFFYTKLWKAYQSIEEENGVSHEDRLSITECYGCDTTLYQEKVVLENLLAHGFGPFDRFKSVNWEYASSTFRELAKFHALSLAYSKKYPEEFETILSDLKMEFKGDVMDHMTRSAVNTALKNVKPENKEALEIFLEKNMKNLFEGLTSYKRAVIIHGDFRGSNLMHRVRENGKVDIKIVDLQTLQGGSPVTDLLYFIFTGSDEEFRAQYYDKLIDHYYTQLSEAMKRLHLNPDELYSREDFDYELKEKLPFGLTLAVLTLPVVTVESENAPQIAEALEISSFSVEKTSGLYTERLNGVVNDYVKWGVLK